MIERQELYCHNCDGYVQFDLDMSLNGNHILRCPNCYHEHIRSIENGKIVGRPIAGAMTFNVNNTVINYTRISTYNTSTSGNDFTYYSWMNSTSSAV